MNWSSLLISLVIFSVVIYFLVKIHKRQYAKLENKKKLRIICLVLLYIASVNYGVGLVGSIVTLASGYDPSSSYVAEEVRTESIDRNKWLYGEWECRTPYGTITINIHSDGTMWESTEGKSVPIDIEENRIWADFGQYGSSYPLDRANQRIGTGEPGYWFYKTR